MATVITRPVGADLQLAVCTVDYTELDAAATTEAISLVTLPDNAFIVGCDVDVVTLFADSGSISALVVEVGTSGDVDALFTSTTVFTGGSTGRLLAPGAGVSGDGAAIQAKFTATGANLGDGGGTTDLDAGKLRVRILYVVLPD
jgi:hypothetical protein